MTKCICCSNLKKYFTPCDVIKQKKIVKIGVFKNRNLVFIFRKRMASPVSDIDEDFEELNIEVVVKKST